MNAPWTRLLQKADQPSATIVLVCGLAGMTEDWLDVLPLLPDTVDVLAIEPSRCPDHPTLARRARMLAEATRDATGPLIWVAHSLAAFSVEALVLDDLQRCDAVVMIDPSSLDEAPKGKLNWHNGDLPIGGVTLARLLDRHSDLFEPVSKLLGPLGRRAMVRMMTRRADPRHRGPITSLYGDPAMLAQMLRELNGFGAQARTWHRLRSSRTRPGIPWVVLLADRRPYGYHALPGEVLRMIPGTGHLIQLERPDLVARAINHVLGQVLARA